MHRVTLFLLALPFLLAADALGADSSERSTAQVAPRLESLGLDNLKRRLASIDLELQQLSRLSLRSGVGPVGFRSESYSEPAHTEWIRVDLEEEVPIDQIVLVPTIWRNNEPEFQADGFPVAMRVIAGTKGDEVGEVVASFGEQDRLLPRIAPLIIDPNAIKAAWIRVEATTLSSRIWDGMYVLQLSEILIFSGHENVALRQPVEVSTTNDARGRGQQFLVDGSLPYLMDAHEGKRSIAFVSRIDTSIQPELKVDLGRTRVLDRIHFHTAELNDTVPQSLSDGFGVPRRLIVEGANESDFSDAVQLFEYHRESIYDTSPIIMRRFLATPCRYVRFIAIEPTEHNATDPRIGFAEIEIFSKGKNVALGTMFDANFTLAGDPARTTSALTDGLNFYGRILPQRNWLNELARRHDLEILRPKVFAELEFRYAKQSANLTLVTWLAILLAVGIGFIIFVERNIRSRRENAFRERLAADLHDELGGNLHAIGLLGDHAQTITDSPEKLSQLMQRLRTLSERTSDSVRYCTKTISTETLHEDLSEDMRRTAGRIMADLKHTMSFEGEEHLLQLRRTDRVDLFLFYKESIVNISRHSDATEFSTRLVATAKDIQLTICDNGRGLVNSEKNGIPQSLKRRARLVGAKLTVESVQNGGTRIHLRLRTGRWRVLLSGMAQFWSDDGRSSKL